MTLLDRWKPSTDAVRAELITEALLPAGDVERARVLHLALRRWQAEGAVVEQAGAHQAVVRWGRTTSHRRHLVASVCSLGCWLPVWLVVTRVHAARRRTVQVTVDEFGQITSCALAPTQPAR